MRLGLFCDVGYGRFGYTLARLDNKKIVLYHCIETKENSLIEDRIFIIFKHLTELYAKYPYELICIEEPCFNGERGAKLNRVLGMLYVLVGIHNTKYLTYNPKTMKRKVTGTGSASKADILFNVQKHFPSISSTLLDDVIDAIGIYICYLIDNELV